MKSIGSRLGSRAFFEPIGSGSGSEVFEFRLVRLRPGCWNLGTGSGSRLELLSLKSSHKIFTLNCEIMSCFAFKVCNYRNKCIFKAILQNK
jgi:hypothetical protein